MKCIYCEADTNVVETRETHNATRRRRECTECDERFTTYEKPETKLMVVKKNGETAPFEQEKIKQGIKRACKKRPVTEDEIEQAVNDIIIDLQKEGRKKVSTEEIGNKVLTKLKEMDEVAYIRFASVYRDFSDAASFESELQQIIKKKEEI